MPIKPPNLDDRQYADILEEMMQLIPQYCPEWTNLGPADPGVTLVQLVFVDDRDGAVPSQSSTG